MAIGKVTTYRCVCCVLHTGSLQGIYLGLKPSHALVKNIFVSVQIKVPSSTPTMVLCVGVYPTSKRR